MRPTTPWEVWAEKASRIELQYRDERLMAIVRRRTRLAQAMAELEAERDLEREDYEERSAVQGGWAP